MARISSSTGLKLSIRRINVLRRGAGNWLITLAATAGLMRERMSAAVCGCSFTR